MSRISGAATASRRPAQDSIGADDTPAQTNQAEMASEIVAAYVRHNSVPVAEMPNLIRTVHDALLSLDKPAPVEVEPVKLTPPVSIKKPITNDYLISLEDGKQYQSLKRHLANCGLTLGEYRTKWGLPADYPMTAAAYSAKRSALAKEIGLG